MRLAGHIACRGGKRNTDKVLVGKPEEMTPLGRPRHSRFEGNIKMDFKEIRWGGMDWIHLAQERDQWQDLVNKVMSLWFPQNVGK
jgi:hypothetical protein